MVFRSKTTKRSKMTKGGSNKTNKRSNKRTNKRSNKLKIQGGGNLNLLVLLASIVTVNAFHPGGLSDEYKRKEIQEKINNNILKSQYGELLKVTPRFVSKTQIIFEGTQENKQILEQFIKENELYDVLEVKLYNAGGQGGSSNVVELKTKTNTWDAWFSGSPAFSPEQLKDLMNLNTAELNEQQLKEMVDASPKLGENYALFG